MKLPHLTLERFLAGAAVVLLWTGGTAYAAATISGAAVADPTTANPDANVMFAAVKKNGTLIRSSGGVSSAPHPNVDQPYVVTFPEHIAACAYVVTPGRTGTGVAPASDNYFATVGRDPTDPAHSVQVSIKDPDVGAGLSPFYLVVVC